MSTVKANNHQIGQSLTATNNFSWYQPSSPDGTVRLGVGNAGATTSDVVTVNSSGNLGLGVTPSAWWSGVSALQVRGAALLSSGNTSSNTANAYLDSTTTWRYINSSYATHYEQTVGTHKWYTAASGSAGGTISFTQAMTLDASGNLLVGLTSNSGVRLYAKGEGSTSGTWSIYATNSSGTTQFGLRNDNYLYAPSVGNYGTTGTTVVVNGNYLGYLSSSLRFKKDVVDYDKGLLDILALRPVYYKSKNANPDGEYDEQRYAGLIAEEISELGFSEFVLNGPDGQINSIQYGNMVALCIKAIQELSAQVTTLQAEINALKA